MNLNIRSHGHMPCSQIPLHHSAASTLPGLHFLYASPSSLRSSSLHLPSLHRYGIQCPTRRILNCRALSSDIQPFKRDYEFRDEKGEVEVRIKLPQDAQNMIASNVFVDAQDTSLSVTLALPASLLNIFPTERLYGRIKSSETVWFVDEGEIVISLKKLDKDLAWPSLLENWESLTEGVSNLLKGVSVYIVGESSHINSAVAKQLAEALGYTPLQTILLLEQVAQKSLENMLAEEGLEAVADAEATIMSTLNSHVRLVVATLGGQYGAASYKEKWNILRAGVTIWLSLSAASDESSAEQEVIKAKQEGSRAYANAEVVVALSGWEEDAAMPVAEGCLKALKYLLESEKDIPVKKNLYVRLGCRGDWPNIMPPGWDPSTNMTP